MVASIVDDGLDRLAAGPAQDLRRAQHRHEAPPLQRVAARASDRQTPGIQTTRSRAASTGQDLRACAAALAHPESSGPPACGRFRRGDEACRPAPRGGPPGRPASNQAVRAGALLPRSGAASGRQCDPPFAPAVPGRSGPRGPAHPPPTAPLPGRSATGRTPAPPATHSRAAPPGRSPRSRRAVQRSRRAPGAHGEAGAPRGGDHDGLGQG